MLKDPLTIIKAILKSTSKVKILWAKSSLFNNTSSRL